METLSLEDLELICVIGGVLICFCFHVVADVSKTDQHATYNTSVPTLPR